MVQPLQDSQPLAHRILRRVKVTCPLKNAPCMWRGDYGDLKSHLMSPSAHSFTESAVGNACGASPMEDGTTIEHDGFQKLLSLASSFKEEANNRFTTGHFGESRDLYSKGLAVLEQNAFTASANAQLRATLLCNRAAAHSKLGYFSEAILDCSVATKLDPQYSKAYIRQSKALVQLGRFSEACNVLNKGLQYRSTPDMLREQETCTNLKLQYEIAMFQLESQNFALAKITFGNLLQTSWANVVLLGVARADLGLGFVDSASRFSLQVLKKSPQSAEAYALRGHSFVLMGEFEPGIKMLRESMRLDPDCTRNRLVWKECKKLQSLWDDSSTKTFHRKFECAVELMTEAIESCSQLPPKAPLFALFHVKRAKGYLRLKLFDEVLKDVALVIYNREDHIDAWLIRFQALHALERHEEALSDATDLMGSWGQNHGQIRLAFDTADFTVRKMKRPNFYKMLQISEIASEREIKRAYRQKALDLHPDRLSGSQYTSEQRRNAECEFKLLGEGLEILADEFKRQLYDEGYDLTAIKERVEAAQRAAHRHHHH